MSSKSDRFVLSAEELSAISEHASARAFPKNAVILNEGDRTDSLYSSSRAA